MTPERKAELGTLRDRLAGPDGLEDVERMLAAGPPPAPLTWVADAPAGAYVQAVVRRSWQEEVPGHRVPVPCRRTVEITAGDWAEGPEILSPDQAEQLAAALLEAAAHARSLG